MNSSGMIMVALVLLNYAIALPFICVAVYQYPPTVPIILLTLILAFWTRVQGRIDVLAPLLVRQARSEAGRRAWKTRRRK